MMRGGNGETLGGGAVCRGKLQRQLHVTSHNFRAGFLCFHEIDAAPATFHQGNGELPRRVPRAGQPRGGSGSLTTDNVGLLAGLACVVLITAALILCLSYERKGNVCRKSKTPRVDASNPYSPPPPSLRCLVACSCAASHTCRANTPRRPVVAPNTWK